MLGTLGGVVSGRNQGDLAQALLSPWIQTFPEPLALCWKAERSEGVWDPEPCEHSSTPFDL